MSYLIASTAIAASRSADLFPSALLDEQNPRCFSPLALAAWDLLGAHLDMTEYSHRVRAAPWEASIALDVREWLESIGWAGRGDLRGVLGMSLMDLVRHLSAAWPGAMWMVAWDTGRLTLGVPEEPAAVQIEVRPHTGHFGVYTRWSVLGVECPLTPTPDQLTSHLRLHAEQWIRRWQRILAPGHRE